jgi:hypothetical protein
MDGRNLRLAKGVCIAALAAITVHAFVRLYVMSQRADASILLINVVLFTAVAGVLIYLFKKERDLEQQGLFGD